jgi:hypothetical protein
LEKPDWEITATTIYCDTAGDEVTLMVYADGTCKCTGNRKTAARGKKKRPINKKNSGCVEAGCAVLSRYRDSLLKS